jgi:hypothetical protein
MEQQPPEEQLVMTQEQLNSLNEWVGIENIATLSFDHERILPDPEYRDTCTARTIDCLDDKRCKIHIKSDDSEICIDKKRISDFRTKNITISGKSGAQFKVIDSGKPTRSWEGYLTGIQDEDVDYWYQILETETTKYVLFPTGESSNILKKPNIQKFLKTLCDKLIKSNTSYCLCGHSMGCVLALNLALLIYEKNPAYFLKKITVIGSGPFRWLSEERRGTFDDLPNVFVFVLIDDGYVDWFFQNEPSGETTNGHYLPYYLLDSQGSFTKMSDIDIESNKNTKIQNDIHLWGNYYGAFNGASSGGKRKPRTKRRTKNKNKSIKKRRKATIRSYWRTQV